jgi:hypothetical protein
MKIYQLDDDYAERVAPFLQYPKFTDIPQALRTPENVLNWLMAMHTTDKEGMSEHYVQIPKDLLGEDLFKFAVQYDPEILGFIAPEQTSSYQDLCVSAFVGDFMAPAIFHEDFRTTETVERMIKMPTFAIKPAKFSKSFEAIPWVESVMTPELFESASKASFDFMKFRPLSEASESALEMHFGNGFEGYRQARKAGRLDLSAQFIRNGHWPKAYNDSNEEIEKPKTLNVALELAVAYENWFGLCSIYLSFLKAHSIEEVIPLITTRKHVSLVIELFSEAELRPFMNTNRHLKAGLLESALGL